MKELFLSVLLVLLSSSRVAADETGLDVQISQEDKIAVRSLRPFALSVGIGSPRFIGMSFFYNLNATYAIGGQTNLPLGNLLSGAWILAGRYYFTEDEASPYLETDFYMNLVQNSKEAGLSGFNLMLGWEFRSKTGFLFNLAGGLAINPVYSSPFLLPSVDISFGNAF